MGLVLLNRREVLLEREGGHVLDETSCSVCHRLFARLFIYIACACSETWRLAGDRSMSREKAEEWTRAWLWKITGNVRNVDWILRLRRLQDG
jgi:hypothetical protein